MKNKLNLGRATRTATYSIHARSDGAELIHRNQLDADEIESLSSENPEGFFVASEATGLESLEAQVVYAILH